MKTATLNPLALYWASFNRFELRLPGAAVRAIAHPGPADADVAEWAPKIAAQVEADNFTNRPTPDKIRAELAEYGAWDMEEMIDDEMNWQRIVWLAAGNIAESDAPDCSEPVN